MTYKISAMDLRNFSNNINLKLKGYKFDREAANDR